MFSMLLLLTHRTLPSDQFSLPVYELCVKRRRSHKISHLYSHDCIIEEDSSTIWLLHMQVCFHKYYVSNQKDSLF